MSGRRGLAAGGALAALLIASIAQGRTLLSQDEALRLAFPGPGARIERISRILTAAERTAATERAGAAVEAEMWVQYRATRDGIPIGTAYFDSHRVRTLPETLMVVVAPDGSVAQVEVVAFSEPGDYLPRKAWFGQFRGHTLDPELGLGRAIRSVTGATLSARAATAAVRRVLAVHAVLAAPPATAAPTPR